MIGYQELTGYHGTFVECIPAIIEDGFTFNRGKEHWLGQGVYFYLDDFNQAKLWASVKSKNHPAYKGKAVAVIKANIKVNDANFLNLNLRKNVEKLMDYALQLDCDFNSENPHANRAFLIDCLSKEERIDVVLMSFQHINRKIENIQEKFQAALGIHFTEQQVCVKNNRCIVEKECVYPKRETNVVLKRKKTWR